MRVIHDLPYRLKKGKFRDEIRRLEIQGLQSLKTLSRKGGNSVPIASEIAFQSSLKTLSQNRDSFLTPTCARW